MVISHPHSLSPDPLYGLKGLPLEDGFYVRKEINPHAVIRMAGTKCTPEKWAESLNWEQPHPELRLEPLCSGPMELVLDFGTELEGDKKNTPGAKTEPNHIEGNDPGNQLENPTPKTGE